MTSDKIVEKVNKFFIAVDNLEWKSVIEIFNTEVYKKEGVPENFTYFIEPDTGHVLSEAMWQHVKVCFARHLQAE